MRLFLFTLALVCVVSVSSAGDLPDLERTMAITLAETRFVVEDVPVRLSREDAVKYVSEDLNRQFEEVKRHFLEGVEKSLTSGDMRGTQVRRCHVKYDVHGEVMWCEGNPYDCLCVFVFAPPA